MEILSDFVVSTLEGFGFEDKDITVKPWGAAVAICHSKFGQMSLAIIDQGGYCSRHFHNQKVNVFNVISGTLQIHSWKAEEDIQTRRPDNMFAIEAGMSWQIEVNKIHLMEARTNVLCMEAYYVTQPGHRVNLDDIYRFTTGGKK